MTEHYEGILIGKGLKFAVVVSRFNELITKKLLEGARDALLRHGVTEGDMDIVWTPGCLEIPLISKKMAQSNKYDAIICLGAVIRGGTPHSEHVAAEVNRGIGSVSLDTGIPLIQGIITADTLEQALQRAGAKEGNKGSVAAVGAIEMANLLKAIQ
ncbi:MAG: 6,7-dimethyl-8-ribityllumazine synthase [Dehalococcoidia bacterium]|nr:6,7-dimethyl-8-ribityllumazine synthase [Dehalococcoidia bacterium]MCK5182208.1 6,7-dimethyl-8-ribityllumazine synthase [Dehalococcoidia bacterium]